MADIQHKRVAQALKKACEETAAQAIAATTASGQASRVHHKNRKFGSRKEAMDAKREFYELIAKMEGVLGALLAKNWIIKTRHPFATLAELVNPLICIIIFAALKSMEQDRLIPAGWSFRMLNVTAPTPQGLRANVFSKSYIPVSLKERIAASVHQGSSEWRTSSSMSALSILAGIPMPLFYFTETTMPGLLINLGLQAVLEGDRLEELPDEDLTYCLSNFILFGYTSLDPESPYFIPIECKRKIVPYKIAITPDTTYTRSYFSALMEKWYPRMSLAAVAEISAFETVSFQDSRVFFDNETALEEYIASEEYGVDFAHPKIYAAIAFQDFPRASEDIGDVHGHNIEYSLRLNSTFIDARFPGSVPRTIGNRFKVQKLHKEISPQQTLCYATRGFMTLQTAVSRFLNCLPSWDATSETTDGTCQLAESTKASNDKQLDSRLLKQLEDDLIISSLFEVVQAVRDVALTEPNFTDPTVNLLEPLKGWSFTADSIPEMTKKMLLKSLQQAPQACHGAGAYVSPTDAFVYAGFYNKILAVFSMGFILSYLYGISRVIAALLMEKETKSRELMRILGTNEKQILCAWFLTYLQLLVVASLLQTIGAKALLFSRSQFGLLFVFFFTFALSSFGYGFLISSLFSRARTGSFVGMGSFFMMFFVSSSFSETSDVSKRTWTCLLSPVALSQGISSIAQAESTGAGINFMNAYEPTGGFPVANAIWMQTFDFVLYAILGLYFERVIPREFGVTEKWYFFVTKTYWQQFFNIDQQNDKPQTKFDHSTTVLGKDELLTQTIESVSVEMKQQEHDERAVVIENLRKEFDAPGGKKLAVKGLSLKLYEGQITCLLGHNGAGKTTLMSMLTGMLPPTSGTAWVNGYSITKDMGRIRQSLGYCPQHSVLYPELTVEERLRFYGHVKGLHDPAALSLEVKNKIEEVGLTEKRHVLSHVLSGGMKRKLSLAIAFLGDSRVVSLDEPTSGMDPYSRRSTWELIQNNRRERAMILTTHFMDEADILGDRIAIMADGELKCVGSSLFLKNRFGVGYRLSFVQVRKTSHSTPTESKGCGSAQSLHSLICQHVPKAKVDTDIGTELTFQLPFESSSSFPALFEEIESKQQELGVLSFAISVTTLEETFLRVAEGKAAKHPRNATTADERAVSIQITETSAPPEKESEVHGQAKAQLTSQAYPVWFCLQIAALLRKRVLCAKRDRGMMLFSVILPIAIVFVGLSSLKLSVLVRNDPKVTLTIEDQYENGAETPIPYSCPGISANDPWCAALVKSSYFSSGTPYAIQMEKSVYHSSKTPNVFGFPYVNPSIKPGDTTGYCLRFAELAFEKGYGHNSSTQTVQTQPVEGQYGGFVLGGSERSKILGYNVMANSSFIHSVPTYKAAIDESIHRFLLSKAASNATKNVTVRVTTHPLSMSFKSRSVLNSMLGFPATMFLVVAFSFIPASIMPFLVKEKQTEQNAKHQQLLSGVSVAAFWIANFIFDILLYLVPMSVTIVLLRAYNVISSLSIDRSNSCAGCTQDVLDAVLSLFVLFGGSIIPLTYLVSHMVKNPGTSLLYTVMLNFALGLLLIIVSCALDALDAAVNTSLVYVWRCSPFFSLGNGLLRIIAADVKALYGLSESGLSALSPEVAGNEITYLAVQGPLFFILALCVDWIKTGEFSVFESRSWLTSSRWRQLARSYRGSGAKLHVEGPTPTYVEDADVAEEARRVLEANATSSVQVEENGAEDDVVQLLRLQKTYPNGKKALRDLSFGLKRGECFGFLGINGAGKTTTMKILTGDLLPTSGTAKLNGFDILPQRARVRRSIGYCPQFDALLDLLTVREHLEFYGRLKGFRARSLEREVDRLLHKLQLKLFEGKLAGSLSGGNKRKLCVAIAMLGGPDLLFLDEPSTGMDPHSRRFMWNVILELTVQSKQTTVMLTTHSMEECEALCNRAGIMVGGRLRCFGSVPHLKARFGDGFLLECKLHAPSDEGIASVLTKLRAELQIDSTVSSSQLSSICAALGKPYRETWIMGDHPTGSILRMQIEKNGGELDATEFCDWWLLEDRVEQLTSYLQTHFGADCTALLERQADFCRFKLTKRIVSSTSSENPANAGELAEPNEDSRELRLSRLFQLVESAKSLLHVKEYSASQTSLEQIFNAFAGQQQEEARPVKGLWTLH
ncbi:Abc transporter a family member 2, partial [Globisporangium splendens]